MKLIRDLTSGFNDATNYSFKENKQMLNDIFVDNNIIDQITKPHVFFLVGDKGTGKTAYSVYMSNNNFANTISSSYFIIETEYQKFVQLKAEKSLVLSDYTQIWKVILYLLMAKKISDYAKKGFQPFGLSGKFKAIIDAIDEFYLHAFSPEIMTAINFTENSSLSAQLVNKHLGSIGGDEKNSTEFSETRYQINLLYLQKKFEEAFSTIKLAENHIIFIDGIDVRPQNIPHDEYLDCVRGLSNAIWYINSNFFSNIKDSKGRMKAILLVRPDIFNMLGLQNQNAKLRDNSILLDWRTTYPRYRDSEIFFLANRLLSYQQNESRENGGYWDHYFPFKTIDYFSQEEKDSFIRLLRYSLFRPRDIVTMIDILKKSSVAHNPDAEIFSEKEFDSTEFKKNYAIYMLGEIKDQISFYHTPEEYDDFLKFFSYLDGRYKFNYEEFNLAFQSFFKDIIEKKNSIPKFFGTSEDFLQFLYDLSIICFIQEAEDNAEKFISWCHRERNYINTSPKVKLGVRYEIHYGLGKALNVGKTFKKDVSKKI